MNYWPVAGRISCSRILNNTESIRISSHNSHRRLPASKVHNRIRRCLPLLLLLCCAAGCNPNRVQETDAPAQSGPSPLLTASSSTSIPSDPNLARVLDPMLDSEEFSSARWGIAVVSLKDGGVIYERNGEKLFTPASSMKVYTTAVALDLLGAEYRWRTSVYSETEPDASGTIRGNLILYGRGAPDLVSENKKENLNSLEELVQALVRLGVKRIQGNVIGDESYFRGDEIGDGWQWNDLQWYFGAEASALSINGNEVDINVTPSARAEEKPALVSSDADGYVNLTNDVATVKRGERFTIGIQRGLSDNQVRVWGEFPLGEPGYGVRLSVHRPALWSARLLLSALRSHGVSVDGVAVVRDSRVPESERFKPESNRELAFVIGQPLSEIVKFTNKESINLNAELVLRTLGRERGTMLNGPPPEGRERGDDETGTALVRLWLSRAGIASEKIALHDGSGLSRLDLVTPRSTAQLLYAISRTASGQVFRESLPIAGTDGTLQGRLKALGRKVVAKTGTLTYDHSLSGYVTAANGETLAFSVMCNDSTVRNGPTSLIDELVSSLANYPANPAKP